MLVFKGKEKYEDFITFIGENMKSTTIEFSMGMPNISGFNYLTTIKDDKTRKKVINALKKVDSDMDDGPTHDETFKKISYFLKVGILYGKYYRYVEKLSTSSIATLATESSFSFEDNKEYIELLSSEELLQMVRNTVDLTDKNDIIPAIITHYEKNPFPLDDYEKLNKFRKDEMEKFKSDKDLFFSDVVRFDELVENILYGKNEEGRSK